VAAWELLDWASFRARQQAEGDAWSPWCREQAELIQEAGLTPVG
jgi:isopentenyl-diphosphate delta-isomerase